MSLKFPVSLIGKRASSSGDVPFATSLYDSGENLLVSIEIDIPDSWNDNNTPYNATRLEIGTSCTVIGNSAFRLCTNLTGSLVIPDNILTIEREAFWGCGFTGTLTIPDSVTTIGDYAFRDCTGFTDLIIEDGLDRIHFNAFQDCAFTSVTLPSTITRLDQGCFYGNSNLTDFTFPESLTIIGQEVLAQCTNITNVNIYVTKTLFEANDTTFPQVYGQLANTGVTTVHVRASDNTWTAGAGQTIGGKTGIEVIKDL